MDALCFDLVLKTVALTSQSHRHQQVVLVTSFKVKSKIARLATVIALRVSVGFRLCHEPPIELFDLIQCQRLR